MEPNSLPGGIYSGIGSGMLGLEMPLNPQQQQPPNPQASQNPQSLHLHHPQAVVYASHGDPDHHQQVQQSGKQGYPFASKAKQTSTHSDEDEPGDSAGDAKRKISPWQRMKWTDNMVRLLIMAVYYIGDEVGSEANDPTGKKKAGGLLQKKGKWKSVSRAMMEKGFCVSPQQCEDKFNDLNKRYKRVNDILGKGTACRVVENQSLLETMDLSPKMKEEVKKLLNSKHLFFREMCAYHNSCGHGAPPAGAVSRSPEGVNEPSHVQHQQSQQQRCYNSSDNSQNAVNSCRHEADGLRLGKAGSDEEDEDEDDDSDEDEEDDDDDDEDAIEGYSRGQSGHGQGDDNDGNSNSPHKRRKGSHSVSPLMQQLSREVASVMQDGSKSAWEKKQWVQMRLIQLEEQQVSHQYQAFELEKQRLKWMRFSSKKGREMERAKLENERRRLETQRMLLLVRHKERELLDHQQQQSSNRRADPSTITGQDKL